MSLVLLLACHATLPGPPVDVTVQGEAAQLPDGAWVAVEAIVLHPCRVAEGPWWLGEAHAHLGHVIDPDSRLVFDVPQVASLTGAPVRLATLDPPPETYCAVGVHLAPALGSSLALPDDDMVGLSARLLHGPERLVTAGAADALLPPTADGVLTLSEGDDRVTLKLVVDLDRWAGAPDELAEKVAGSFRVE
ncbi:MAG: hypothetical protein H6739_23740 [Alphaproteobacteria bacterium]|nr:hypothetical protein [Alphaproteobacteria bacterium]